MGLGILPVFFNGAGKMRLSLYLYLVSSVLIVVAAPLLALQLGQGVNGLIYALLVVNVSSLTLRPWNLTAELALANERIERHGIDSCVE